tara:strand:+ start:1132 stop:1566 length:435 start_codon:yes stop_codon:yes gene_type:complete
MREDLNALDRNDFVVGPKTDGERFLVCVYRDEAGRKCVGAVNRKMNVFKIDMHFGERLHDGTVLDCELTPLFPCCSETGAGHALVIFDAYAESSNLLTLHPFDARMNAACRIHQKGYRYVSPLLDQAVLRVKRFVPVHKASAYF